MNENDTIKEFWVYGGEGLGASFITFTPEHDVRECLDETGYRQDVSHFLAIDDDTGEWRDVTSDMIDEAYERAVSEAMDNMTHYDLTEPDGINDAIVYLDRGWLDKDAQQSDNEVARKVKSTIENLRAKLEDNNGTPSRLARPLTLTIMAITLGLMLAYLMAHTAA
jgi:hypothetical protein